MDRRPKRALQNSGFAFCVWFFAVDTAARDCADCIDPATRGIGFQLGFDAENGGVRLQWYLSSGVLAPTARPGRPYLTTKVGRNSLLANQGWTLQGLLFVRTQHFAVKRVKRSTPKTVW